MSTMLLMGVQTASVTVPTVVTTFAARGTALEGVGSPVFQGSTDSITYALDFTAMLVGTDTIAGASVSVFSLSNNQAAPGGLVSRVAVVGKTVAFTLASLTAQTLYRVTVVTTLSSGNIEDAYVRIFCPF